jgi:tRNA 2-selenouridine synthase
VVQKWQSQIAVGQMDAVVRDLLLTHYDPTYASSLQRNFSQSGQATPLRADNRSPQAMQALARQLVNL